MIYLYEIYYKDNKGRIVTCYVKDFYSPLYCPFTYLEINDKKDGIILGSILANINISFLCHKTAVAARNIDVKIFDEFEKNCNTCNNLKRIKTNAGSMKGYCDDIPKEHPYYKDTYFYIHPTDHMDMKCWVSRDRNKLTYDEELLFKEICERGNNFIKIT